MNELIIVKPFDMHVHLRQGELLSCVTPFTAQHFSRALVMPNLKPPICTPEALKKYREEILVAAGSRAEFEPLMTFKIMPGMSPEYLLALKEAGAIAGKVYPKGLTTNAEDGVEDYFALWSVFSKMQELGLVLCLHGEKPGANIEGLDREKAFLRTLFFMARTFPNLHIVLEHITTEAAVEAVLQLPNNVAATITVHHLLLTHDDVGGDRMRPHNYCKPVAKRSSDRAALIEAAISGCPKFFFGSDSAPHTRETKECSECCAGIFTAPVALPLLAQIFDQHNALPRLETFVHHAAGKFYGLKTSACALRLVKERWNIPRQFGNIVPFMAGERLEWMVLE
jgi:dihydroorotase